MTTSLQKLIEHQFPECEKEYLEYFEYEAKRTGKTVFEIYKEELDAKIYIQENYPQEVIEKMFQNYIPLFEQESYRKNIEKDEDRPW